MSSKDKLNLPELKTTKALHPINQTKDYLIRLLSKFGFDEIDGPEIETEEFNFDMLNIKKSHPARQMHDTFYVEGKNQCFKNSYITCSN